MYAGRLTPDWRREPWLRAAVILGAGAVVALAGSAIVPVSTRATPLSLRSSEVGGAELGPPVYALPLPAYVGTLPGRNLTVDVYIGRKGPMYTVKNRAGAILGERLTSDEVYARFPELGLGGADPATDDPPGGVHGSVP